MHGQERQAAFSQVETLQCSATVQSTRAARLRLRRAGRALAKFSRHQSRMHMCRPALFRPEPCEMSSQVAAKPRCRTRRP